jgi:hypothetical protein
MSSTSCIYNQIVANAQNVTNNLGLNSAPAWRRALFLTTGRGGGRLHLMATESEVRTFVRQLFDARNDCMSAVKAMRRPYRERYFHDACDFDSRSESFAWKATEEIDSVSVSKNHAAVITNRAIPPSRQSRYHLCWSHGVILVELEESTCLCPRLLEIHSQCRYCKGSGWKAVNDLRPPPGFSNRPPQYLTPEESNVHRHIRDETIDEFMTNYLRDRTEVWGKEFDLYASFARRFYAESFDRTRGVASAEQSKAEKVLCVAWGGDGAYVVSKNSTPLRWRYNLIPRDTSWLITQVDLECPLCAMKERKHDCIWCGGTLWHHTPRKRELE